MSVKLALPTFDPARPLTFDMTVRIRVRSDIPEAFQPLLTINNPVTIEFWPDAFAGWVRFDSDSIYSGEVDGVVTTSTSLAIMDPAAAGLRGGEGWFAVSANNGGFVYLTDCIVTYTPAGAQGSPQAEGFFS